MKNSILILASMACFSCSMLTLGVIFGLALAELYTAMKLMTVSLGILTLGGAVCAASIKEGRR